MQNFQFLDHYNLLRVVGTGGMGQVYEAHKLGADGFLKTVAVKTINPDLEGHPEFIDMFIGEAKLVADLVHPNIVQIYQLARQDQIYYISMEFIKGVDLRDFIARHRAQNLQVPYELATFIVSRIARALEYAHAKTDSNGVPLGIVHRDISPKNIMVNSEGEVKLTDFGLAKAVKYLESKEGTQLMGSVEYMSPEQASGQQTGPASDLFSLGLVYYELLTGVSALRADNVNVSLTRLIMGKIVPPERENAEIPENLLAIVRRCLALEPEARYPSASDLSYTLEYEMYKHGYGPTIMTLANYLASIYPERGFRGLLRSKGV